MVQKKPRVQSHRIFIRLHCKSIGDTQNPSNQSFLFWRENSLRNFSNFTLPTPTKTPSSFLLLLPLSLSQTKMVTLRQRTTAATGEPEPKLEEERLCEDLTILSDDSDDSPSDSTVKHLRERWELASVLNFLNVFGPLVSEKLKLTAEEIEMGLIECNTTNAQLHISLLKDGHDSEDTKKSTADMTAFAQNLLQQMVPDNVGLHHHKEYPYNSFMY